MRLCRFPVFVKASQELRSRAFLTFFVGTLGVLSSTPSIAESTPIQRKEWKKQAESWLHRGFENGYFHGAAILIEGENVICEKVTGFADAGEKAPNTLDTKFRLASLTKLFTQVAILRLVDEDKIDLDAPLDEYRPAIKASLGSRVKIRHLLAMTSGLPREIPGRADNHSGVEFDEHGMAGPFLDSLEGLSLQFRPGAGLSYSNVGYWMLGAVIEAVTRKTYASYLDEAIFRPLGMSKSGLGKDRLAGSPGTARGHWTTWEGEIRLMDEVPVSSRYASGGLCSTPRDLLRFARSFWTNQLFSDDALGQIFHQFGRKRYEVTKNGGPLIKAAGAMPGFANVLMCHIEEGYGVLLLNNLKVDPPGPVVQLGINLIRMMRGDAAERIPSPARRLAMLTPFDQEFPTTPFARNVHVLVESLREGNETKISSALAEVSTEPSEEERQSFARQLAELRDRIGEPEILYQSPRNDRFLVVLHGPGSASLWMNLTASSETPSKIENFELRIGN